jgi:hypothetical protein
MQIDFEIDWAPRSPHVYWRPFEPSSREAAVDAHLFGNDEDQLRQLIAVWRRHL